MGQIRRPRHPIQPRQRRAGQEGRVFKGFGPRSRAPACPVGHPLTPFRRSGADIFHPQTLGIHGAFCKIFRLKPPCLAGSLHVR
jgi:hypothetical protein